MNVGFTAHLYEGFSTYCSILCLSSHNRGSLLKNSIAELYEEDKHRKAHLYETNSQQFDSKTR